MLTKSEITIHNILEAAAGLFLERNYADVTMAQIAEAAAVTKGALYHHFTSKEELYLAFLHSDLEAKRQLFAAAIAAGGSCRERLAGLTRAFLELPSKERASMKLVRRDINVFEEDERAALVRAYQVALPQQVQAVIEDGIRAGELKSSDARLLAWQFIALVEVILTNYAAEVLADTAKQLNHVLDLFFGGAAA